MLRQKLLYLAANLAWHPPHLFALLCCLQFVSEGTGDVAGAVVPCIGRPRHVAPECIAHLWQHRHITQDNQRKPRRNWSTPVHMPTEPATSQLRADTSPLAPIWQQQRLALTLWPLAAQCGSPKGGSYSSSKVNHRPYLLVSCQLVWAPALCIPDSGVVTVGQQAGHSLSITRLARLDQGRVLLCTVDKGSVISRHITCYMHTVCVSLISGTAADATVFFAAI